MAWTGWLEGQAQAAPYWPGIGDLDEPDALALLTSALEQCQAYAPDVTAAAGVSGAQITDTDTDGTVVEAHAPESWRLAQALQARALYRSGIAGSGDQIGVDGLSVTVFPMDWTVKNLLRPRAGKPVIW